MGPVKEVVREPSEEVQTAEVIAPEEAEQVPEATSHEATLKSDVSEVSQEEPDKFADPELSEEPSEDSDDEFGDSELSEEPTEDSDDEFDDTELSEEPSED